MKRIGLCVLTLLFSGCVSDDVEQIEEETSQIIDVDSSQLENAFSLEKVEIQQTYKGAEGKSIQDFIDDKRYLTFVYGEILTATNDQEFLNIVETQLQKFDPYFGIYLKSESLPLVELEQLYKNLMNTDDQISATLLWYGYEVERVQEGAFISFYNAFTTSKHEYSQVIEKMDELIKTLDIENLTPYEKVETLYAYVMERMTYKDLGTNLAHSPMGFLFHGEGVCQAYAVSLHMLLERAGIESRYIIGTIHDDWLAEGETGGHAWNMVKLDGNWYHLDPTWDDEEEEWSYFLVSDTAMSFSRSWEKEYYDAAPEPYVY